ncbi:MFS transporter [Thalassobaculum fulvum]|uniref:MFS transporter n=1 Tax=Thalassobaculum fulvum TaxID=1633335 RepID=A0A918XNZ3_9PROT|nr:MFS transporter [Thalassobaculum fulvum]GHD43348.1 MFS transporter [Thalassobaculum fulvum]
MISRRAVWSLAIAETVVWAGTLYLFPALLTHWEADLGWSKTTLAGAFTLAVLISAASAPVAGRLIDAGHGVRLLTWGTVAAAVLVALLSQVREVWQFYAVWAVLGVAAAACLYEPCSAFLVRTQGADARRVLTLITLVTGFASALAFAGANAIAGPWGWRAAVLAFAAMMLVVATPLFHLGGRDADRGTADLRVGPARAGSGALHAALRRPAFWLLATAFPMIALNHGILITHLLPMLAERGVSPGVAVLAASGIGPMQVVGRLLMMSVERRVSMNVVCGLSFALMAGGVVALILAEASPVLLAVFVILEGAGYGVTAITRPVVSATVLGRDGFGAISGALALPFITASAMAPTLAAAVWSVAGYDAVRIGLLGLLAVAAVSFFLAIASSRRR